MSKEQIWEKLPLRFGVSLGLSSNAYNGLKSKLNITKLKSFDKLVYLPESHLSPLKGIEMLYHLPFWSQYAVRFGEKCKKLIKKYKTFQTFYF